MVAQPEPVRSWGHKPCGEVISPTTTWVSGWRRAPRPPGIGRGDPEVQTLLYWASELTNGGASRPGRKEADEQRTSQAAALSSTPVILAPSHEGCHCDGADRHVRDVAISRTRLGGDLGTAYR